VAYEYESGDKSLKGVDDVELFLGGILYNSYSPAIGSYSETRSTSYSISSGLYARSFSYSMSNDFIISYSSSPSFSHIQ